MRDIHGLRRPKRACGGEERLARTDSAVQVDRARPHADRKVGNGLRSTECGDDVRVGGEIANLKTVGHAAPSSLDWRWVVETEPCGYDRLEGKGDGHLSSLQLATSARS